MFDNSQVSDKQIMRPELRKENCELVQIRKVTDEKTGASSVIFKFVDSTKAELEHREFEPSRKIGEKTLNDEEFKKNVNLVHSRIAHITRAFLPEEVFLKIKVADSGNFRNDWNTYLKLTAQALGVSGTDGSVKAAKGVKCALKVVYKTVKGKNYASLPNVPAFISTELHPKEFSINPTYDKFEIEKIFPDTEKPADNGGGFGDTAGGFDATSKPAPSESAGFGAADTQHESGF